MRETPPPAKLVVLDDDPTGTQTVHGVPVITEWSPPSLAAELAAPGPCFFILTNSRAYPEPRARAIYREIGLNLVSAGRLSGRPFQVVSRGDSTLRGHYPAETDALAAALGGDFDATLIIPAFFEAGRVTKDDIHYVAVAGSLVPVGDTEFARDAAFGYRSSNLRAWVGEKTGGRVSAAEVVSFSLDDLRGDRARLVAKLGALTRGTVAIVNGTEPGDLQALTAALAVAQAAGKKFLFRTAASFVAAQPGVRPRPLLRADEIAPPGIGRGLVVVGSHVEKTTRQLQSLLRSGRVSAVEVAVGKLLAPDERTAEVARAARQVEAWLAERKNVALATSRAVVTGRTAAESLAMGEIISRSMVAIVSALRQRPRWLVVKGGITSSEVATEALGVRRAMVLGQALPGVPVWKLGPETRWPGLAYVIFPGNVGDADALGRLVASLD